MREKDSELRGLISDFYNKYPNTEAILLAGASVVKKEFSFLINKVKNYTGQYGDEFLQQLYPINQMLNSALQREEIINVRSQSSELLASIVKLMEDFETGELSQTLALPKLKELTEEFESLKNKPAFKALPEDEAKGKENIIAAQLFMVEKVLTPTFDRDNIKDEKISVKGGVQREDTSKVFDEIDELLNEAPEDSSLQVNPNQNSDKINEQQKSNRSSVVITPLNELTEEQIAKEEVNLAKMMILIRREGKDWNLKLRDEAGKTLLEPFVTDEKLTGLKYLLKKGADPNQETSLGGTVLHIAVKTGNLDMVKALLANNADPNRQNAEGKTALHIAAELNRRDIAEALIANNANREIRDASGKMAFELVPNNKRSSQQMASSTENIDERSSKKVRLESTLPKFGAHRSSGRVVAQKPNITIDVTKIEASINKFINPTSMQPEMRKTVAAYNSLKDVLSGTNPELTEKVSQLQGKFETSRRTIIEALGYGSQIAAVEKLVDSDRLHSNTSNTKELHTAVSKLSDFLESTLQSLENERKVLDHIELKRDELMADLDSAKKEHGRFSTQCEKIIKALGDLNDKQGHRNGQRLNAAIDNIEVTINKLDQLKHQLEQKLPASERPQANVKLQNK